MSLEDVGLHLVESIDDAQECKRWLGERREILAVDTETGGLEWWREPLRLVVLGDERHGWAIPWELWAGVVHETLGRYSGEIVFHNAKFDLHFLEDAGLSIRRDRVHDTATAAHLLNPLSRRGLKFLSAVHLDPNAAAGQELLHEGMKENGWTWRTVPHDFPPYWAYAALDGVLTARLWSLFRPKIETSYQEVYDLEMAVQLVLLDMESRGVRVDFPYVDSKIAEMTTFIDETREWVGENFRIPRSALKRDPSEEFLVPTGSPEDFAAAEADGDEMVSVSPTSNRQVAAALIADGVELEERTPSGGWKLDEPVLASFAGHPLADAVLNIRKAGKYRKSYFESLRLYADGDVVHATMNALGARTGRMSLEKPPLHQIPRGPLVRDAFIPRDGNVLVSCDFDQIEMRLLAHYAEETTMIEAIRRGVDLHGHVAESLFGPDFTKEQRQGCKGVNFGKVYGAGDETMAKTIGCSVAEAREFRIMYEAQFPRVNSFMREVEGVARQRAAEEGEGYVVDPFGRRHPADLGRFYALVNYLIQGTAAGVFKRALVDLDLAGLGDYLILPVHDEAILDVPRDDAEEIARVVGETMTDATTFAVPLTASAEILPERWGDKYREAA